MRRLRFGISACALTCGALLVGSLESAPPPTLLSPSTARVEPSSRGDRLARRPAPPSRAGLGAAGSRASAPPPGDRPSFLWASRPAAARPAGSVASADEAVHAAREHLAALADTYGLTPEDVADTQARAIHLDRRGASVVALGTAIDGVEVFRREVRVVMDRDLGLVAVTGNLPSSDELAPSRDIPRTLDAHDAVDRAVRHVLGASAGLDALERHGGYQHFALRSSGAELGAARSKPVVATTARGLRPGHYVEVDERGAEGHEPRHVAVVIDAEDGTPLYTHDLVAAEAYSYRAFGAPDFGSAPWDSPLGSVATPHPTGMRDGFAPVASPPRS